MPLSHVTGSDLLTWVCLKANKQSVNKADTPESCDAKKKKKPAHNLWSLTDLYVSAYDRCHFKVAIQSMLI